MTATAANDQITNLAEQAAELADELLRRFEVLNNNTLRSEFSFAQYRILSAVHNAGPLSVGKTAHLIGSAQSTTSELMSRLLKRGLISKVRGIYDGRVVMVEITDEGRSLLRKERKRIRESYRNIYVRLTEGERGELVESLKTANNVLQKADGGGAA